jgi:hypothetical protein
MVLRAEATGVHPVATTRQESRLTTKGRMAIPTDKGEEARTEGVLGEEKG